MSVVSTHPHIEMTRESAEILLTRQVGFRINEGSLEFIKFTDEDVAVVRSVQPVTVPFQQLWRRSVANAMALGNAEQRERELMATLEALNKTMTKLEDAVKKMEESAKTVQPSSVIVPADDEDDENN